jgi:hypothetical protein
MRNLLAVMSVLMFWGVVLTGQADASRPVPRTITGCVIGGTLYSLYPSTSEATGKESVTVYRITVRDLNLQPYEGKKIRVRGKLLPRDRFYAEPGSVKVLGPCDKASRRAISER